MIADVVEEHRLGFAVPGAARQAANAGASLGQRSETRGIRQQCLEELQRHDLLALKHHRVDARHADIAQHLQMIQVVVGKGHPEASTPHPGKMLDQGLEFLVVHQVNFLRTDAFGEIEQPAHR